MSAQSPGSGYPLIERFLDPIAILRRERPGHEESPIVELLTTRDPQLMAEIEGQLEQASRVEGFEQIFDDLMVDSPTIDERISKIYSEVRVAQLLTEHFPRVRRIVPRRSARQPRSCDFVVEGSEKIPVEVKDIGGEWFRGMKPIAPGLGFGMGEESQYPGLTNAEVLAREINQLVESATGQIRSARDLDPELAPGIVVLVVRRAEHWLFVGALEDALKRAHNESDKRDLRAIVVTGQLPTNPLIIYPPCPYMGAATQVSDPR